ncbi:hypothetical protein [Psychrobacillus vulpis]|uniref:Uncharacterized protein n=1 Tax=Psychrobacillus vulpis TaxID=2325572 RepID=A0A544TUT8_9BACI|nr:hypothetical protein [Psychrobacillus vulpis]TQR21203.1 hypothetical protein FG384_03065 [Psychrobacillus vulpis]
MMYMYMLYIILSACVLLFISNKNLKEWLLKMTVVSFLPIIGWFLPVIWAKKFIKNKGDMFGKYINKQNEDISVELLAIQEKIEKEKELNIVPIEEALVVSDYSARRKVMIDVLKEDTLQYMDVIKTAVLNEDTETSHYAVTAVMEIKRKLSISLQELSVKFDQNNSDTHIARAYAQVLKEYMDSGFLDDQTIRKYKFTYIHVLNQLIQNDDGDGETFEEKVTTEMELSEYSTAENTCLEYLRKYPNSEKPYICLLKLYYTTKSTIKMQSTLDELKRSTIKLSNQALTIVRYWSGGTGYEGKRELL